MVGGDFYVDVKVYVGSDIFDDWLVWCVIDFGFCSFGGYDEFVFVVVVEGKVF